MDHMDVATIGGGRINSSTGPEYLLAKICNFDEYLQNQFDIPTGNDICNPNTTETNSYSPNTNLISSNPDIGLSCVDETKLIYDGFSRQHNSFVNKYLEQNMQKARVYCDALASYRKLGENNNPIEFPKVKVPYVLTTRQTFSKVSIKIETYFYLSIFLSFINIFYVTSSDSGSPSNKHQANSGPTLFRQ